MLIDVNVNLMVLQISMKVLVKIRISLVNWGNLGQVNINPVMFHTIQRNMLTVTLPNSEQFFANQASAGTDAM